MSIKSLQSAFWDLKLEILELTLALKLLKMHPSPVDKVYQDELLALSLESASDQSLAAFNRFEGEGDSDFQARVHSIYEKWKTRFHDLQVAKTAFEQSGANPVETMRMMARDLLPSFKELAELVPPILNYTEMVEPFDVDELETRCRDTFQRSMNCRRPRVLVAIEPKTTARTESP